MIRAKSGLSICALVPYPPNTTPSQRFRIEQWMPYLREAGIGVDLLPFVNEELMRMLHQPGLPITKAAHFAMAFARHCSEITRTYRYDALLIHRTACVAGPALLERLVKLFNCPIIYDFDDAIFHLHTTTANRYFGWLKFPGKTASICRLSSHVVVGNQYLADYARQHNAQVTVIPSSVDTNFYNPRQKKESQERVIVGWTGSSTSQTYLESFAPLLRELLRQREVELHVISDRRPEMPGVPLHWHRWSPETEITDLARFDIGIMPMPDDLWARGKCSMKALLYMAMGIPTICSAVGMNREVIQHGQNGLLANTDEEWLHCLKTLIDDVALRKRLGDAGRKTIEERYSMQRCAALFANVIRDVVTKHNTQVVNKKWFLLKSKNNAQ
ncbi:MAG: glycosyltransferase family 4 protein [Acidobacteria bacterium]|nr:glycosyltransferase family 4 protein [Acidobacteriota bacterium]